MSETDTIKVAWPPMPLGEPGWRQRLECLGQRAERLLGRRCNLQAQAELATEWFGLAWPAIGPELIAGSCRASLLVGENVVVAERLPDQLNEVAERLHQVWEAAQEDPSAAVAKVGPLLLNSPPLPPPKPLGRKPRSAAEPEPEPSAPSPASPAATAPEPAPSPPSPEPAEDPDELPLAWRQALEPKPVVAVPEPEPVAAVLEEPAPAPAPAPEPAPSAVPSGFASAMELAVEIGVRATAIGQWAVRNLAENDIHRRGRRLWFRRSAMAAYVPMADRPRKPAAPRPEPPAGWFTSCESAEILECSVSTLGRWRMDGRFGVEGVGWVEVLGRMYYEPSAIENAQAAALDELLNDIRDQ